MKYKIKFSEERIKELNKVTRRACEALGKLGDSAEVAAKAFRALSKTGISVKNFKKNKNNS